jgi:hypothetical protein
MLSDIALVLSGAGNQALEIRDCHAERRKASVSPGAEMLRCAQHDKIGLDCKKSLSAQCLAIRFPGHSIGACTELITFRNAGLSRDL